MWSEVIWGNWLSFGPQLTREQRRLQNRICLHFKEDKDKKLPSVVFLNSARSRFCSEHFSRTTHVLNVYCRSKNRVWSLLSWLQPHPTSKHLEHTPVGVCRCMLAWRQGWKKTCSEAGRVGGFFWEGVLGRWWWRAQCSSSRLPELVRGRCSIFDVPACSKMSATFKHNSTRSVCK